MRAVRHARKIALERRAVRFEPGRVESWRRELQVHELQQCGDVVARGPALDFLGVWRELDARTGAPGVQEPLQRSRSERAVAHGIDGADQVHRVLMVGLVVKILTAVAGSRQQDFVVLEIRRLQDDAHAVGKRPASSCRARRRWSRRAADPARARVQQLRSTLMPRYGAMSACSTSLTTLRSAASVAPPAAVRRPSRTAGCPAPRGPSGRGR